MIGNNFEIQERDGKIFLFSPQDYGERVSRLHRLAQLYKSIGDTLREYGYTTKEDWQFAIANEGGAALERLVAQDTDDNARRLRVQRYLADTWREVALSKIPRELTEKLNLIPREISNLSDGIVIYKKDFKFKERTIYLNEEDISARLRESLTIEVPEAILGEARKMREIILSLRELEEGGLNAKELLGSLVGEYLAPDCYPALDENSLILSIFSRRHPTRDQLLISAPEYVAQVAALTKEKMRLGLYGLDRKQEIKQ